ncbi:short-chain dehydrogenase/reductase SDR [Paenibacillus curdlanolyticus YK9]|uniref:Short-chain dehydrogenase/reductase SDR n=1 Tax=Paenibacillus curdlanolyticus YK9 TaxID=717606 RepID=E0ID08_9BACL|nr:SDR family oxidoreductase [Paenibacillus curdlanolyticus]EFM09463.1 short-chain dehydrogenase/reductase SDR [Paenibacillus curdlanolyticus YK9]
MKIKPNVYGYKTQCENIPIHYLPEYQPQQPGLEYLMKQRPLSEPPPCEGKRKLEGKVAVITGGDSGIGRAVAYAFAKEGADLIVAYYNEHIDAIETKTRVEQLGRQCLTIAGDIGDEAFCRHVAEQAVRQFGRIDILVNNAAVQFYQPRLEDISREQLELTFRTNIFAMFHLTKAVLPHMKPGSAIINTSSVLGTVGLDVLIDYSATKGAINAFTRALAGSVISRGIRVNAVAPGATWTPLVPASFPPEEYESIGFDSPMKRNAQPFELAGAYVYLASDDSSYVVGEIINVNGGAYFA